MCFDENPFTCQCEEEEEEEEEEEKEEEEEEEEEEEKKRKKLKGFTFGIFVGCFSDIMAVKRLNLCMKPTAARGKGEAGARHKTSRILPPYPAFIRSHWLHIHHHRLIKPTSV